MVKSEHLAQMVAGVTSWNPWRIKHPNLSPDLVAAELRWAYLPGIDFSRTSLERAVLHGAIMDKSDLRGANLTEADLSYARLSDALLDEAVLSRANLRGTDLRGSKLRNTDLRGANLREADLRGADLSGAALDGVDLNTAHYNPQTIWPEGVSPSSRGTFLSVKASGESLDDSDFTIDFAPRLSPDQIKTAFAAIADYYRTCGGVGLRVVDFESVTVDAGVLIHA
jgi:uncharacterized protein YjbI with pentapeptide repeats